MLYPCQCGIPYLYQHLLLFQSGIQVYLSTCRAKLKGVVQEAADKQAYMIEFWMSVSIFRNFVFN